jgi:hypothetical protein
MQITGATARRINWWCVLPRLIFSFDYSDAGAEESKKPRRMAVESVPP